MIDPDELFSKAMYRALNAFNTILTFRQTANLAIDSATSRLLNVERMHAESLFNSANGDRFFIDKAGFLDLVGGIPGIANTNAKTRADQFISFSEASSLIFAHSLLDAIAQDLCLIALALKPSSWRELVQRKKVSLGEILEKDSIQLEREVATAYVETLERESLIKKIDHLFMICKPPQEFNPSSDYAYDRAELTKLDEQRHEIVHGDMPARSSVNPGHIRYLQQTAIFLCAMVSNEFGVKADIRKAMEFATGSGEKT